MTTHSSTAKSNMFSYILYKIGRRKGLAILNIVFSILCFPLIAGAMLFSSVGYTAAMNINREQIPYQDVEFFEIILFSAFFIGISSAIILFITTIITPSLMYSYNNKKCDCDMYLSLPLSNSQRFFGDFISGLAINLLPLLLNLGVGFGFICITNSIIAMNPLVANELFNFESHNETPGIILNSIIPFTAALLTMIFVVYIGAYFISVFISSVCGRSADSIIYSLLSMMLIPGFLLICTIYTGLSTNGINTEKLIIDMLSMIPPFGLLINGSYITAVSALNINPTTGRLNDLNVIWQGFSLPAVLIHIAVFAVLIIGAYLLSRRRKAEKAGQPFVYNTVYYVLSLLLISCIALLFVIFISESDAQSAAVLIAIGLFLTAITHFFVELSHYRGFKRIWQWALRYIGTIGCTVLVLVGMKAFINVNNSYIPSVEAVESVTLSGSHLCNNYYYDKAAHNKFTLTSDADKQIAIDLNEQLINCSFDYEGIVFEYKFKDGSTRKVWYSPYRNNYTYGVEPEFDTAMLFEALFKSDEFINQYFLPDKAKSMTAIYTLNSLDIFHNHTLNAEHNEALINALISDIRQYGMKNGKAVGSLQLDYSDKNNTTLLRELFIYDSWKNVIALLGNESNSTFDPSSLITDGDYNGHRSPVLIISVCDNTQGAYSDIFINEKDIELPELKELISLCVFDADDSFYKASYQVSLHLNISQTVLMSELLIPDENAEKARECIAKLIKVLDNSQIDGYLYDAT